LQRIPARQLGEPNTKKTIHMKKNSIGTKAMLALIGSVMLVPASSEATLTYNDGDLLLGFRATGGTGAPTSYLVNLGSIAQFLNANATDTILTLDAEIGNIGLDLSATYGSWQNRLDVLWSVTGVQKTAGNALGNNTLLVSRAAGGAPWQRLSSFGSGAPALKLQGEGQKFAIGTTGPEVGTDQIESTNSAFALIQPDSQFNSHESYQPGGPNASGAAAYGVFNGGVESSFEFGTSQALLDFYVSAPGSGDADFIGQFSINNTGTVTFTPEGVPEPSTAMALGLGALALGCMRRRTVKS
jgi:hypothetical protein